ncbi:MAG: beta-lactamase family protein [Myxococcales bacterium]|nr:beta-lactamase family protein [Myxococcales bacterium]
MLVGLLLSACDDGAADSALDGPALDAAPDSGSDGPPVDAAPSTDAALAADARLDPCRAPPPPDPAFPLALAAELQAALDAHTRAAGAPGVVVGVALVDGATWAGAAGLADGNTGEPMTPSARFRVGSVTKTFTAALIMQHVEAGDWTLDDPIDAYVPGYDFGPEVTLARLLAHTAGVYNYTDDAGFLLRRTMPQSPRDIIDFALQHESGLAPGEAYLYSNTGYYLLGLALEAVEARPFPEIVRDRLLTPFGVDALWMEQYEPSPSSCDPVTGHVGGGTEVTEGFSMSWAWAAGGLVGPVGPLCVWARALFAGDVVSPMSRSAMIEPTPQSIAAGEPYGLGVRVTERGGRPVLGHTGSTMGFRGELFFDPANGLCVTVETNDFTADPMPVAEAIWAVLR